MHTSSQRSIDKRLLQWRSRWHNDFRCRFWCGWGRGRGRLWWGPRDGSILKNKRSSDDLVFMVDSEVALLSSGQEEFGNVVGVERTGLGGQTTGKVRVANDLQNSISISNTINNNKDDWFHLFHLNSFKEGCPSTSCLSRAPPIKILITI